MGNPISSGAAEPHIVRLVRNKGPAGGNGTAIMRIIKGYMLIPFTNHVSLFSSPSAQNPFEQAVSIKLEMFCLTKNIWLWTFLSVDAVALRFAQKRRTLQLLC